MSRLKSFDKLDSLDKKKSNRSIWVVLVCLVVVVTLVIFSSYAKYVFINGNVEVSSGSVTEFYYEELLNGSYPVLSDNLVPVTIGNDGTVYKASLNTEWYKYEDKRWANSLVLRSNDEIIGKDNISGAIINSNDVYFDGIDDYVNLGLEKYNFNTNISISVNFKFNSFNPNAVNGIIGNWQGAGAGLYYNNGELIGTIYIKEIGAYVNTSVPFSDLSNYHVATMTYDGNTIKLFLDGQLVDTVSAVGTYRASTLPFLLGANPNEDENNNLYLIELANVNIREYAIYNTTLSDNEVISDMSDRVVLNTTNGLLSYGNYTGSFVDNSIIPESHIESYFVWIPKYSYRLWDLGNYNGVTAIDNTKPHSISIRFGTTNTNDGVIGECSTPGIAGSSGNCSVGDYMTHPAFLAFDTNGLWVGKFETGYDGATSKDYATIDGIDVSKVIIKPDVYSWRGINVGNAFKNSYEYLRESDSHMMKNIEWGAVAYLSHSIYGINTEVRINNNYSSVTGFSASIIPTLGTIGIESNEGNRFSSVLPGMNGEYSVNYYDNNSVLSSTTSNYSGIYDMVGGSWEYTMAVINNKAGDASGIINIYSDFYTNSLWEKYYDKYSSTTEFKYSDRILGDATGEMGPMELIMSPDNAYRSVNSWYNDFTFFYSNNPWFRRGGYIANGTEAGIFSASCNTGAGEYHHSYRIVLAPKN